VEWVRVLDKLLELYFDTVIPGHGALLTKIKGGLAGYDDEMRAQRRKVPHDLHIRRCRRQRLQRLHVREQRADP
jgi:hypothetical protein